jgi:predicted transposase/invertase (TIGR01784 family)
MNKDKKINNLINPHDKLFRAVWSNSENAAGFLEHYLPNKLLQVLDIKSLEIAKDSFIEKELKDYYSDILYMVNLAGKPGYIYILFEHKSYFDSNVHLQLLEYMTKIWRQHIKNKKDRKKGKNKFPIIIPILICHSKQIWAKDTAWFSSYFTCPVEELADYIPNFKLVLHDLNSLTDEQIKGTIMGRVVMLLFKYAFDSNLLEKLPNILSLMDSLLEKKTGLEYFETIIRYLFGIMDNISADTIKEIAEQAISTKKGGELVMTLAEQLYKEGELKGITIGELKGITIGELKGKREGLTDAIELGMVLKFPEELNTVMEMVNKIKDINALKNIKDSIKSAKNPSDIIILAEAILMTEL